MSKTLPFLALAVALAGSATSAANAAEYTVKMLNKDSDGQAWQFEPAFLKIAPGDTVTFVPADKGHNSETTEVLVPDGSSPWKGKINENITVKYDQEGVYLYKCLPHAGLGMVGVIQVGDSQANLDAVEGAKLPGKGKVRLAELLGQVGN
jgi:pseudoazurin